MINVSIIKFAEIFLKHAKVAIPDNEKGIRGRAYELLKEDDPLTANSIRFGKDVREFNKDDWKKVLETSEGRNAVKSDPRLLSFCMAYGLKL
jgi:hypothetical protein